MESTEKKEEEKIVINDEFIIDDGRIETIDEYLSPEELYNDLISRIHSYHPSNDYSLIEKAYDVAQSAHKDQKRKSGEPYIIHPLYVAIILADLQMDLETIAAGLLHDVIEDTKYTYDDLKELFGPEVATIVDGVTKLEVLNYAEKSYLEKQAENLRKMFLSMAKDIRVIIVKLADRLHNMRTLKHMSREKQIEKSRETLEIYAPIAQRLGISKIKVELEDLSLKYLKPDVYYDLVDKIAIKRSERDRYVESIVKELKYHLDNAGIEARVDGRVKHFYSIYKKMVNQNKSLEQIYDLFAVRVIVKKKSDCYSVLGLVHDIYKPIAGRFKDYISQPKTNMYQSLHTTLIGTTGQPFEVQIRTEEMHKAAEYGVAAHWKYKTESNGGTVKGDKEEEKLSWLATILEWQKEYDNPEFLLEVKNELDLYNDDVYCYTPNGEVKHLPMGSNTIDFAYAVHTAVGNKMIGARVNGTIVPITYVIQNADVIDIITSDNSTGPKRDWLASVRSPSARNKIKKWFEEESKEESVLKGSNSIKKYCIAHSIDINEIMKREFQEAVLEKYHFKNWESMLAAVGRGALKEGQVVNKLEELYRIYKAKKATNEEVMEAVNENAEKKIKPRGKSSNGVIIENVDGLSIRLSKCCGPLPGDDIVGYVTRGRGVTVHRIDCINIQTLSDEERQRLLPASWDKNAIDNKERYEAEIRIFSQTRNGLYADITRAIEENNIQIVRIETVKSKREGCTILLSMEISGKDDLDRIIQKIKMINGVVDAERN